jgi:hypothetical protein
MKRLLLLAIAASPLGAQPSVPAWTISSRPTLDVGDERNTQTQFDGVNGILRMPGGEIVVANAVSQELRVFSASGNYLRTLAPGGRQVFMRSLDRVWRGTGDTVYAVEILQDASNVLVFTLNGFVARRQIGAANAGGVYPIERFPDGHFVVSAAPRRPSQAPLGLTFIDSVPLGIVSFSDLAPKWIGSLRNEMFMVQSAGGGRRGGGRTAVSYPYGRRTSYAVSGDRLWVGDSETGTITQHTSAGRGVAVFAAPTAARPLDTAAIRRLRTSLLSDAMNWNDRARMDAAHAFPYPKNAPRFAEFLPGINGEMWIAQFREDPSARRTYVVVDRTGAAIGRVTAPPRVELLEIGATDVLGILTDGDGIEHVVRHTLRRTAR